eukprot:TRINITY_DN6081_c0_g1_i1.p1 TRINITY_DN6081_c0_g1~~TRINITY_DN6081_c0_g1_i1.p1  ORF type:complete len:156 (+),score=31.43 TRINITY_DN6081_c0_g1_i1:63-530(+)
MFWNPARVDHDICKDVPYPPEEVYEAITSTQKFESWWPDWVSFKVKQVKPDLIGTKIDIITILGTVNSELVDYQENKSTTWTYENGPMVGNVRWTLGQSLNKKKHTHICYKSRLQSSGVGADIAVRTLGDDWMKSCGVGMIDGLEVHLDNINKED